MFILTTTYLQYVLFSVMLWADMYKLYCHTRSMMSAHSLQ